MPVVPDPANPIKNNPAVPVSLFSCSALEGTSFGLKQGWTWPSCVQLPGCKKTSQNTACCKKGSTDPSCGPSAARKHLGPLQTFLVFHCLQITVAIYWWYRVHTYITHHTAHKIFKLIELQLLRNIFASFQSCPVAESLFPCSKLFYFDPLPSLTILPHSVHRMDGCKDRSCITSMHKHPVFFFILSPGEMKMRVLLKLFFLILFF